MTTNTTLDEFKTSPDNHESEPSDQSNDTSTDAGIADPIFCPCYLEERDSDEWEQIKEQHDLYDPGCGHAISYFTRNTGSKTTSSTARLHSSRFRIFIEYLHERDTRFTEVTIDDIDQFMNRLARRNYSKSTLSGYRTAICNVIRHISLFRDVDCDIQREMVYEAIDISSYNTASKIERTPLSKEEAKKLFAELGSYRNGLIVQMGIELGPRSYDLRTILVDDVDIENQKIELKNTKADDSYVLPIGSDLALRLRHWIESERAACLYAEESDYLFPSKQGGYLSEGHLNRIIKNAAEAAGVQEVIGTMPMTDGQRELLGVDKSERKFYRVTAHALRHTFSDLLDDEGLDLSDRSAALNHESTEVTKESYSHRGDEYKDTMQELFSNLSLSS